MSVPLSKSVVVGDLIFVSGQIYLKEGELIEGNTKDKTEQIMRNIQEILMDSGAKIADIVKTTIYVTDMVDYEQINSVYAKCFIEDNYPAREVVCVKALPLGAEIEISVIARRSE